MDDVEWLDPEELTAWMHLMALMEVLPAAVDAQLRRDGGMNHFEYMVLAGLVDAPDHTVPMSHLAALASGSLSRLSHAISRMEQKGWVERRPVGVGRRVDVVLTEAGAAANRAAAPGHVREARRLVIDTLTRRQLLEVGKAARRIIEVASPEALAAIESARRGASDDPA